MNRQINNKDMLVRVLDKLETMSDIQILHTEKLRQIEDHVKKTNGSIARAQLDIANLDTKITEEDKELFWRLVRYFGISIVLLSFLWIKESRDIILEVVKVIW